MISALLWVALLAPPQQVFQQAAAALQRGDLSGAEKGFLEVLKAEPDNLGALGNLGVVYSRQERIDDAITIYQRVLKLAPNEPGIWLNLGLAYLKLDDFTSALPLFDKLNRSPRASAQSAELLSTCLLQTGQPGRAVALLEALPRTPGTLFLLGSAYLKLKQKDKAKAAFDELFTSAAGPAQSHYLLGRAYNDAAQPDEALAELKKALGLDPKFDAARFELAKVHLSQRDNDAAEQELRALPPGPEVSYYLGALLVLTGREKEAIPWLELARKARPNGWGSYYYLGRAELQSKNLARALPLLEKAAQLNPDETAAWFQLARAYQQAGRPADAAKARARLAQLKEKTQEYEERVFSNSTPVQR